MGQNYRSCLLIEFFVDLGRLGIKRKTLKVRAKQSGGVGREDRHQETNDPVLPNKVIGVEDLADVRNERLADRLENSGQYLRNRPVGILQPFNESSNDWCDRRKASSCRGVSACHIGFVCGHKFVDVHDSVSRTYQVSAAKAGRSEVFVSFKPELGGD